jgi:hypothetical protein
MSTREKRKRKKKARAQTNAPSLHLGVKGGVGNEDPV